MNPEQNRRQCKTCRESEPSFIHTVFKNGAFKRLCTNCLLKEERERFCPVCLEVYLQVPRQNKRCFNCSAITHLSCCLPPSTSSSTFVCDPCKDPDFVFFPKSFVPGSEENGEDTTMKAEWAKALVAAANIAEASVRETAERMRKEANKKIRDSVAAKLRAKEALGILQDLVSKEEAEKKTNPNKRKDSDR